MEKNGLFRPFFGMVRWTCIYFLSCIWMMNNLCTSISLVDCISGWCIYFFWLSNQIVLTHMGNEVRMPHLCPIGCKNLNALFPPFLLGILYSCNMGKIMFILFDGFISWSFCMNWERTFFSCCRFRNLDGINCLYLSSLLKQGKQLQKLPRQMWGMGIADGQIPSMKPQDFFRTYEVESMMRSYISLWWQWYIV